MYVLSWYICIHVLLHACIGRVQCDYCVHVIVSITSYSGCCVCSPNTHTHTHTASKIRGTVAGISFENFHKYSNEIIRAGVFGRDKHGKVRDSLVFPANNLVSDYADLYRCGSIVDRVHTRIFSF